MGYTSTPFKEMRERTTNIWDAGVAYYLMTLHLTPVANAYSGLHILCCKFHSASRQKAEKCAVIGVQDCINGTSESLRWVVLN